MKQKEKKSLFITFWLLSFALVSAFFGGLAALAFLGLLAASYIVKLCCEKKRQTLKLTHCFPLKL